LLLLLVLLLNKLLLLGRLNDYGCCRLSLSQSLHGSYKIFKSGMIKSDAL